MTEVSVIVPTFRRPADLRATLESLLRQENVPDGFETIVVDNDSAASARDVVAGFEGMAGFSVRYVHEPAPGISCARNTGVRAASGRLIAFIDDDEIAVPNWLASFVATIRSSGADIVFGPVLPRFPEGARAPALAVRLYTRDARVASGTALDRWGQIGNTILDRQRCIVGDRPFEPQLGLTGGEDAVFIYDLARRGRRLAWCAEAVAIETESEGKITTRYLLHRMYRGGQTTSLANWMTGERWEALRWMIVGAGQVALYGPLALALKGLGSDRWLSAGGKAASGMGKIFWHPALRTKVYGATAGTGQEAAREG